MKVINFIQEKIVDTIAVILFFISASWMLIEALSRQFFSKSFAISEELIVFSLVWAVLLTLGSSGKAKFHVSLDLFVLRFGDKFNHINRIVVNVISIVYTLILLYLGVEYLTHLLNTGIVSSSPLRLQMGYVLLSVPIGMFFLTWYYILSTMEEIKGLKAIKAGGNKDVG